MWIAARSTFHKKEISMLWRDVKIALNCLPRITRP